MDSYFTFIRLGGGSFGRAVLSGWRKSHSSEAIGQ
jgi:hypothetical protein